MILPDLTSCRVAARRASRAMDEPLSPAERMLLRAHLLMCARCTRFSKQLDFLREAEARFAESPDPLPGGDDARI